MLRTILYFLSVGLACCASNPRSIDGIPLRGISIWESYHHTLLDDGQAAWVTAQKLVATESNLWIRVAPSLEKRDPDLMVSMARETPDWSALECGFQVDSPYLVALLILENRWVNRHTYYQGETSPAYQNWRAWTGNSIRVLTALLDEDQAKVLHLDHELATSGHHEVKQEQSPDFQKWFQEQASIRRDLDRKKAEAERRKNTSPNQRGALGVFTENLRDVGIVAQAIAKEKQQH